MKTLVYFVAALAGSSFRLMVLLFLFSPLFALAHLKTDVVILNNGDRVTGEIKSLLDGRLSLSTDSMGTVAIEWKDIDSLRSDYNYELRLSNGERHFGKIVGQATLPGTLVLETVFEDATYALTEVVELRPIAQRVSDRIDVYLSANYAFTKASGVTQTEFRANASYEDEDAETAITSRLTISDTDEETTSSSRVSLSRQVWTNRERLYRLVFGGFESNDELSLDSRVTIGAGLGRYFFDNNRSSFNGSISVQALEEQSTEGDRESSVEGVISLTYSRWRFDSPKLNLDMTGSVYPSLTESGRLRADNSVTLRWELIDDLFWDLSAWSSFDNETIDEGAGEFDWGITTGVGWSF
ncbi:MAG: DUF481 domain-containing protein [Pseudomonadota bacterium]